MIYTSNSYSYSQNDSSRSTTTDEQNYELYDSIKMPGTTNLELLSIQEKFARGEKLTLSEKIKLPGHDHPVKNIGNYICKSNCCYRVVSKELFEFYKKTGFIEDLRPNAKDYEIIELEDGTSYTTNAGIDWYLGGIGLRYGEVVIECPAYKKYFKPAIDNGTRLTSDLTIRHMKSSPKRNPVPMSIITNVFDLTNIKQSNLEKLNETSSEEEIENRRR